MSLLHRLLGGSSGPQQSTTDAPVVDDGLERWVVTAEQACAGLGPAGRLVVALLGESLADPPTSFWFGYEPSSDGLADLLRAVGEDPAAAVTLTAAETELAGRRLGVLSDDTRQRWRQTVDAALLDPAASAALPQRDELHREAEVVWRTAAAGVQSWRAVQLDPDRALGQVRWYPGCRTRTLVGYADPLGLAAVERSAREHRPSAEEWQALLPAEEIGRRDVDPLAWRLSSLAFVAARAGRRSGQR